MSQWSCCVFSCAKQINLTFNLSIIFCGEKMYCDKKKLFPQKVRNDLTLIEHLYSMRDP